MLCIIILLTMSLLGKKDSTLPSIAVSTPARPVSTLDNTHPLYTTLGSTAILGTTLDFYGNVANRYQFSSDGEMPLAIIQSDQLFEVIWYFTQESDTAFAKSQSQNHTEKVERLLTVLYGKQANPLINAMLNHQPTPKLSGIVHAKCQHYTCRLVLDNTYLATHTTTPPTH